MMSTLYIDRKNLSLFVEHDALIFREGDKRINTVPLNVLERICIKGETRLGTSVLAKLGEKGIGLLVLNGRMQKPNIILPCPKTDSRRRIAQYQIISTPKYSLKIARCLVSEKINRQAEMLADIDILYPESTPHRKNILENIKRLTNQVAASDSLEQVRGVEGIAAVQYFQAWQTFLPSSLSFQGRNRRPPRDPVNAVLSLGYTLLHFDIVRQLYLAGLDPYIGIYHKPVHGRESLASDLLEPFRPRYDQWALQLFRTQMLREQDFSTNEKNGCQMGKAARIRFYQAYEQQAKEWRKDIRQSCTRLLKYLAAVSRQPDIALDGDWMVIENETNEESEAS